jgi:hypothetical protein
LERSALEIPCLMPHVLLLFARGLAHFRVSVGTSKTEAAPRFAIFEV